MHADGWPTAGVVVAAATVLALLEHVVVAAAVIAALLAAVLLVFAGYWGHRLWKAYTDLTDRVGKLEDAIAEKR